MSAWADGGEVNRGILSVTWLRLKRSQIQDVGEVERVKGEDDRFAADICL